MLTTELITSKMYHSSNSCTNGFHNKDFHNDVRSIDCHHQAFHKHDFHNSNFNWLSSVLPWLSQCEWFPDFLRQLKTLVAFFRNENYTSFLKKELRDRGLYDLAHMLESVHLIHFAHWRWQTLYAALDESVPLIDLRDYFAPESFGSFT